MLILLGRDISKIQPGIDEIHKIDAGITTAFIAIHFDSLAGVCKVNTADA